MTPLRVLIIEETVLEAAVVEHILRRGADFQPAVTAAHNLDAAASFLATHAVDVVLLNLVLPDWNLHRTLDFIAQHAPRVPLVVLSASGDPIIRAESLSASAQDYLIKWQFGPHDLWRSIRFAIERHWAAKELGRAKQEAELANQAKSRFLATMSHEIRTPLGALLGMAELLAESDLSGEQQEHLGVLQGAGAHLHALISDVLDMGKIEAGALNLEQGQFSPRELVQGTLGIFHDLAAAKHLDLRATVDPRVPAVLLGDAHRLRQVLLNLVGNAIKFTAAGQVELRLACAADPGRVTFSVSDTGPGIAADKHQSIFDPFVQAEASTARVHGGTGLGLAISRGLVALMGGTLGLLDQPGQGSCFSFTLNLPAGDRAPAPAPADPGMGQRPLQLLIVDDTPALQILLAAFVRATPHRVEIFADGAGVVPRLGRGGFDLVLLDLHLPEMDGFAILRRLRAIEAAAGRPPVPVIAMTADVLVATRRRCEASGFAGFLAKPMRRADFLAAIAPFSPTGAPAEKADPADQPTWDEDAARLMPGYLRACDGDLATLQIAQQTADFSIQRLIAHRLKGSGGTFGLPAV
jgi:signal transduction histidine kinase/ActR/RegA family two-component response regulator